MPDRDADAKPLAETDAIRRLLGGVTRRDRKKPAPPPAAPPPEPPPALPPVDDSRSPAAAFVGDEPPEPPPPLPPPVEKIPVPVARAVPRAPEIDPAIPAPVPQPATAVTFAELVARTNWHNRPERVQPMPLLGVPGHADTVGAVLAAFAWDDE